MNAPGSSRGSASASGGGGDGGGRTGGRGEGEGGGGVMVALATAAARRERVSRGRHAAAAAMPGAGVRRRQANQGARGSVRTARARVAGVRRCERKTMRALARCALPPHTRARPPPRGGAAALRRASRQARMAPPPPPPLLFGVAAGVLACFAQRAHATHVCDATLLSCAPVRAGSVEAPFCAKSVCATRVC
jgi:hypothetical protein